MAEADIRETVLAIIDDAQTWDDGVEHYAERIMGLFAADRERQAAEITRLQSGGCARDQSTTQYCAEAAAFAAEVAGLRAEVERLRAELSAATGYMLNAKIDLETGAQKRTAIATIEGGLKRARAALPPAPESSDA